MARPLQFSVSFAFRVDETTAARMRDVAASHALTPAEWARQVVTESAGVAFNAPQVRRRVLHADILREYLGELGRQGSNLSQIAKSLNTFGKVSVPRELEALNKIMDDHRRVTAAILGALGASVDP
jgi:hypothetical protein